LVLDGNGREGFWRYVFVSSRHKSEHCMRVGDFSFLIFGRGWKNLTQRRGECGGLRRKRRRCWLPIIYCFVFSVYLYCFHPYYRVDSKARRKPHEVYTPDVASIRPEWAGSRELRERYSGIWLVRKLQFRRWCGQCSCLLHEWPGGW
jgi:hypothetical protein